MDEKATICDHATMASGSRSRGLDTPSPRTAPPASVCRAEGPNLVLRLVELDDADYIYGLRTDPVYSRHLSPIYGTASDQRRWIEAYKIRENLREELYYIIERKDGQRCGTLRLYAITAERFTWGSWILDHHKTRKAALESAMLSFDIGFEALDLPICQLDVRISNTHAQQFYRRFGMKEVGCDHQDIFLEYHREPFRTQRDHYLSILLQERQP